MAASSDRSRPTRLVKRSLPLLLCLAPLLGCGSSQPRQDPPPAQASADEFSPKVQRLQVGVSTTADVLALFGNDPMMRGKLPQTHSDVAGKLPAGTPEGDVERLVYLGHIDLSTAKAKTLFVYLDSADKVCLVIYE